MHFTDTFSHMSYPTHDELTADEETLPAYERITVPPEFEDFNGHMNIAHYLTTASWGAERALWDWGVPQDWVQREQRGTFSAEHHLRYFHEVHVGAEISTRVRAVARSERALHLQVLLLNDTERVLAYVMELLTVHVDLTTRRTAAWPDAVAKGLDAAVARHAAIDWPLSGCLAVR